MIDEKTTLYVLDLRMVTDYSRVGDYFQSHVFGKTAHERNMDKLSMASARLEIIVLCREQMAPILRGLRRRSGILCEFSLEVLDTDVLRWELEGTMGHLFWQSGLGLIDNVHHNRLDSSYSDVYLLKSLLEIPALLANVGSESVSGKPRAVACTVVAITGGLGDRAVIACPLQPAIVSLEQEGQSLSEALSRKLRSISSERSLDGPVSRHLMRPLSGAIGEIFSRWGMSPNTVTTLGAAFALASLPSFATGGPALLTLGSFFWFLSALMDIVDGEVARLQGRQSTFGAWLDLTFDRLLDGAVIVAIYWPFLANSGGKYATASVFTSIIAVASSSYIGQLYDAWMRTELGQTVYFRLGRDTRNAVIITGALLGFRLETIWLVGAIALTETLRRLWVCWNWERVRHADLRSA